MSRRSFPRIVDGRHHDPHREPPASKRLRPLRRISWESDPEPQAHHVVRLIAPG